MNHANHHIHFGADGHPTLELLRQYQEGLLSPALSHQLERHLLECELCADIAEGMALSDATQTKAAVADIHQRLTIVKEKRRVAAWYSDWRAVAAVFVLFCSAIMVVYYQYTNLQTAPETIAVEKSGTIVSPKTQESESKIIHELAFSSPPSSLDEAVSEEAQLNRPIVKPKLNTSKTIVASDTYPFTDTDEEVFPEATIAEIADADVTESVALGDVSFDLKQDSLATIATAKPKAKVDAAAPQMSFERVLQGQVAGVALQRNAAGATIVQGKVTDTDGFPLPGVTVQVKGTMQGVTTDANGSFSLQLPEGKNTLTFRYIGFETKEQQIDSATSLLAINLEPDNKQLSEVVVTGYGKSAEVPVIEKPEPTIGLRAYKLYLKNAQRSLKSETKGRVIVGFTVTKKGQLENVQVLRSLNPEADAEAIRLIQQGPAWEPATQNGSPVERQVKVVVRFR